MADKLKELDELHKKFYALYGELHSNGELLGDVKTYKIFAQNLLKQYETEYELLNTRFETEENPELYRAQVRHALLSPRNRFIFWRNRAKKQIDGEVLTELEEYFTKCEDALNKKVDALNRLIEAMDASIQENSEMVFDEPAGQKADVEKPKKSKTKRKRAKKQAEQAQPIDGQVIMDELPLDEPSTLLTDINSATAQT